ncbi:hypothetical protein [Streptomyces sp. NPDC048551]|uniref:hypothetical protein n=1 Tax=Streptomyces sp. NPDC048551 TaxID=3155758 RepID=UPI003420189D
MESPSSEAPRTIERLHTLSTDLGVFHELLTGARPVAGSGGLPTLASWYATAQGLSATALTLLLTTSEQGYAHTTVSGHHAVESLGQLVKASSDITAHVMGAVAVAAEYHRVEGLPDPATGRTASQPAVRRPALDGHLDRAVELIQAARAACHNAVAFTETAALREAARTPAAARLPELSRAEHQALRAIADGQVLLAADRRNRRTLWSSSGDRVSTESVDRLMDKELIRLDPSGSLAAGQHLRPTELGRTILDIPQPPPAPVTLTAIQHRALHLIHTSAVMYSQWPRKRAVVDSGSPERITARSVDALVSKRLVTRDFSTGLYAGQRLRLTPDGLQVLRRLGPAPEPALPARPHNQGPALAR